MVLIVARGNWALLSSHVFRKAEEVRALERELKFLLQQNNGGSGGIFLLSGVKSPRLTPIGGNETAGGGLRKERRKGKNDSIGRIAAA